MCLDIDDAFQQENRVRCLELLSGRSSFFADCRGCHICKDVMFAGKLGYKEPY